MRSDIAGDVTDDGVLNGRLKLLQPRRGHRFGHDAILLAAAVPAVSGEHVADLGAGVGTVGLAIATRVPGTRIALIEIDAALADLAKRNVQRNGLSGSVAVVTLDVGASEEDWSRAGIGGGTLDGVAMNPPFHEAGRTNPSPDAARRIAHIGGREVLKTWMQTASRLLRDGGTLTMIYRADALGMILSALTKANFGDVAVLPIYPAPDSAAIRVIVGARKGGAAGLVTLPGLTLNDAEGQPTAEATDILRHAGALKLAR